jgi:hypothetical protein
MKMTDAHKRTGNAVIHGRHCRKLVTRLFTSGRLFYTSLLSLLAAHKFRRQPQTKQVETRRHATANSKLY